MATSALDAATDLTAAITLDRDRSRRQVILFSLIAAFLLAVAVWLVPYALEMWGFWFAIAVDLLFLVVLLSVVVGLLRHPDRRLIGLSPRGVFVPMIPDPVPWQDVAAITVLRTAPRRGITAADRLAATALTAGGLNAGGRVLHFVLADAAAWRARLGPGHAFLVTDGLAGEQPGASGFKVDLTQTSSGEAFETFVAALAQSAAASGIPVGTR